MFNPVELRLPLDGRFYVANASKKYYILEEKYMWKVFFGKKPNDKLQYDQGKFYLLDYDYIFEKDVEVSIIINELEKFIKEAQSFIGNGYDDWLTVLKGFNRVGKINKLINL